MHTIFVCKNEAWRDFFAGCSLAVQYLYWSWKFSVQQPHLSSNTHGDLMTCYYLFFPLYADVMLSDIHHHPNVNKHPLKAKAPMVSFDQKSLSSNLTWVVEVDSAWKPISAVQPLWPAYVLNGTFNYYYSSCFLTFAHCEPFNMNKNFSVPTRI